MQKKIIALAVAGLVSGAAFAQTNVTVYGVADAYWAHGSGNGNSVNVVNAGGLSGSRLGFKGVEDLGNGLKAVFLFEFGTLSIDAGDANNNGIDNTRQSYVGLTGGFGTAVAGRLQTPGYDFGAKYDAHGGSVFSPAGQLSDNAGASVSARDALARQNNSLAYISPTLFGGLTAKFAYSYGTGGENVKAGVAGTDPQDIWALSADYDAGPLSVGYVHHDVNDFGGVLGTDQTEDGIGVNYDFGMAKLSGSYQTQKVKTTAATLWNSKLWNLGARVKAGAAGSVGIAYGQIKDSVTNGKAKSWGLDYQHALSKRTTAYAGYSRVSNNSNIAFGLLNVGSTATAVAAGGNGKESQLGVGLRHTF